MPNPIKSGFSKDFTGKGNPHKYQGYSKVQRDQEVAALKTLFDTGKLNLDLRHPNKTTRNRNKLENIKLTEGLLLGQSGLKAKPGFLKKLASIRDKISGGKTYGSKKDDNGNPVYWFANLKTSTTGSGLKGAKRIHEKSLIYTAEGIAAGIPASKLPELCVQKVRDVLRATIEFETVSKLEEWCGNGGKTNNIIDLVNSYFPVLRVKNRFVSGPLPMMRPVTSVETLSQLFAEENRLYSAAKERWENSKNKNPKNEPKKVTRDSFYRDIQMLVLLENGKNGINTAPLTHHIAEVQINTADMMGAKHIGHEAYERLRVINGYMDVKQVFEETGVGALRSLLTNEPSSAYIKLFYEDTRRMAEIYRSVFKNDVAPEAIRKVINNSQWAKANNVT